MNSGPSPVAKGLDRLERPVTVALEDQERVGGIIDHREVGDAVAAEIADGHVIGLRSGRDLDRVAERPVAPAEEDRHLVHPRFRDHQVGDPVAGEVGDDHDLAGPPKAA